MTEPVSTVAFVWLKKIAPPLWRFLFQKEIDTAMSPLKAANAALQEENLNLKGRIRELEAEVCSLKEIDANFDLYEPFETVGGIFVYREKIPPQHRKSPAFFCTYCYESRKGIFTIQRMNLLSPGDKRQCSNCGSEYIISVGSRVPKMANTDYNLFGD
ncbi:hypothetical protein [Pantoea piersonii]|nr:hypothetical protein [Pantoea piersonii]MBZ6387498.1 hypothetical protein [Pantoea piersonii]MBZ6400766.1 hypothetical protein [Pantoea piersonii]MBZ6408922.1 hypothetical protein [Pantoea piersonii]